MLGAHSKAADDSALRIEIGLRAAMIAKAALELLNLEPSLCRLQLDEVAKHVMELDTKLKIAKP